MPLVRLALSCALLCTSAAAAAPCGAPVAGASDAEQAIIDNQCRIIALLETLGQQNIALIQNLKRLNPQTASVVTDGLGSGTGGFTMPDDITGIGPFDVIRSLPLSRPDPAPETGGNPYFILTDPALRAGGEGWLSPGGVTYTGPMGLTGNPYLMEDGTPAPVPDFGFGLPEIRLPGGTDMQIPMQGAGQ